MSQFWMLIDTQGDSRLTLGFNELQLDARIAWKGHPLELSATRPTKAEMLADDSASSRMAGYLVSRLASRAATRTDSEGTEIHLVYYH